MTEPEPVETPEAVRPYLLARDGTPQLNARGAPYLDAIVDVWGLPLCTICVYDALPSPPYSSGTAYDHAPQHVQAWSPDPQPPRVTWYARILTDAERERAHAYLRAPGCTPERHAWFERQELERAEFAEIKAENALREARAKPIGWSIEP